MPEFLIIDIPFVSKYSDSPYPNTFNRASLGGVSKKANIQNSAEWLSQNQGQYAHVEASSTSDVLDILEREKNTYDPEQIFFRHKGLHARSEYVIAGSNNSALAATFEDLRDGDRSEAVEHSPRYAWGFPRLFELQPTQNALNDIGITGKGFAANSFKIYSEARGPEVLLNKIKFEHMDGQAKKAFCDHLRSGEKVLIFGQPVVDRTTGSAHKNINFVRMEWDVSDPRLFHLVEKAEHPINEVQLKLL